MKGKLLVLASFMVTGSLVSMTAFAQIYTNSSAIPTHMNPGTEIRYDQNNQPVIVQFATNTMEAAPAVQSAATESSINATKQLQNKIQTEITTDTKLPRYKLGNPVLPAPKPGMQVFYDGLGDVFKILLNGQDITSVSPVISVKEPASQTASITSTQTIQPMATVYEKPGQYWYGSYSPGPNGQNWLGVDSQDRRVDGDGQVTWYSDTYGDGGQILQNNSCATKINYDQPMDGTPISVSDNQNYVLDTLYKQDVGSLPNAVLDIRQYEMSHVFGVSTGSYYGSFFGEIEHSY